MRYRTKQIVSVTGGEMLRHLPRVPKTVVLCTFVVVVFRYGGHAATDRSKMMLTGNINGFWRQANVTVPGNQTLLMPPGGCHLDDTYLFMKNFAAASNKWRPALM